MPLFNHAQYIEERLETLFSQWLPGFELLLIDDASADAGFAIAERTLARHPDIPATTVRNKTTLGMGVLPVLLELARGDVIVQADSDDIALPGRLQAAMACFDRDPACRLVTSNAVLLSADGFATGLYETVAPDQVFTDPLDAAGLDWDRRWLGATIAFHRALFDDLPLIDPANCPYGLDLLLPFRALLLGSYHYLSRPLVGWRQHGRNRSHLVGSLSTVPSEMERYQSSEMMILAQKLKDAEYVRRHPGLKPVTDDVVDRCKAQFEAKYDDWCRLRTATQSGPDPVPPAVPPRERSFSARPPVATLHPGQRIAFDTKFGIALLAGWNGFHPFDGWGTWTERHALTCFRVTTPNVVALRVAVTGLAFAGRQRVGLSAGWRDWTEIELTGTDECIVDLPVEYPGMIELCISAHDAACPPSGDLRLLGVRLHWVEAVTKDLALDSENARTTIRLDPC